MNISVEQGKWRTVRVGVPLTGVAVFALSMLFSALFVSPASAIQVVPQPNNASASDVSSDGTSSNGGGSGGGYHANTYEGWATWDGSTGVTNSQRTAPPEWRLEGVQNAYLGTSAKYRKPGDDAVRTMREMLDCLWLNGDGCGIELKQPKNAAPNNNALVGGPDTLSKCSAKNPDDIGKYTNPVGFTFKVDVQWWNSGYGTSGGGDASIITVVKLKDVDCAKKPESSASIGTCPWWAGNAYLDGPYAYRNMDAVNPNNVAQRAGLGAPVPKLAKWKDGSLAGVNWRDPSAADRYYQSLYSSARIARAKYLQDNLGGLLGLLGLDPYDANYSMSWGSSNYIEGDFNEYEQFQKNVWQIARDECGWTLKAGTQPARPKAGDYDNASALLGHYYTYAEGWTLNNCRMGAYGKTTFRVNGVVRAESKKGKYWNGCKNATVNGDRLALSVNAADESEQYTVTCTATDAGLNIRAIDYGQGKAWWRNDGASPELYYSQADFNNVVGNCTLPPPTTPVCDATGVTTLKVYANKEGTGKPLDVLPAGQWGYFNVPRKLGKGTSDPNSDVDVKYPAWYDNIGMSAEEVAKAKTPQLVERTFTTKENGALPERGDGNPNNDPVILQNANAAADDVSSLLTTDYVKTPDSPGKDYEAGLYDTTGQANPLALRLKFVKSTGTLPALEEMYEYGGLRNASPGETSYSTITTVASARTGGLPQRLEVYPKYGGGGYPSSLNIGDTLPSSRGWWVASPIIAAYPENAKDYLKALGVPSSVIAEGPGKTLTRKDRQSWGFLPEANPANLVESGGWKLPTENSGMWLWGGGRGSGEQSTQLPYGGYPYLVWQNDGMVVWKFMAGAPYQNSSRFLYEVDTGTTTSAAYRTPTYSASSSWWNLKVWDPYLQRKTGTKLSYSKPADPLPFSLKVANGWKAYRPEYHTKYTPGDTPGVWGTVTVVATRDANGNVRWVETPLTRCGVGEVNVTAVKPRGGGSAVVTDTAPLPPMIVKDPPMVVTN